MHDGHTDSAVPYTAQALVFFFFLGFSPSAAFSFFFFFSFFA